MKCYEQKLYPEVHAGIQYPTSELVITDYQDTLFHINYDDYRNTIDKNNKYISQSDNFKDIFLLYLEAFKKLDPLFSKKLLNTMDTILIQV